MLLSPELLMPMGPPPQAVLDQRWLWQLLIFILGITFGLRLVGLDIAGALLSGLMLCFAVVMTRDGMQEMAKYSLVYAVLSGLNFFFDILPLITELGGRVTRTTEPGRTATDGDGIRQTSYTLTTKTIPFFDGPQGLIYNVQSLAMIMSPVCMALGVYLAITAHNEIQRHTEPFWNNGDMENPFGAGPGRNAGMGVGQGGLGLGDGPRSRGQGPMPPRPMGGTTFGAADSSLGRETFERFTGQGHKLGD
mmetsp:Transcript_52438/g.150325  ORF Transcript_52438/g.150325 Transcript_52438/m.150325 type:complete len:249 (+) Transcript_52438:280-1026(+)